MINTNTILIKIDILYRLNKSKYTIIILFTVIYYLLSISCDYCKNSRMQMNSSNAYEFYECIENNSEIIKSNFLDKRNYNNKINSSNYNKHNENCLCLAFENLVNKDLKKYKYLHIDGKEEMLNLKQFEDIINEDHGDIIKIIQGIYNNPYRKINEQTLNAIIIKFILFCRLYLPEKCAIRITRKLFELEDSKVSKGLYILNKGFKHIECNCDVDIISNTKCDCNSCIDFLDVAFGENPNKIIIQESNKNLNINEELNNKSPNKLKSYLEFKSSESLKKFEASINLQCDSLNERVKIYKKKEIDNMKAVMDCQKFNDDLYILKKIKHIDLSNFNKSKINNSEYLKRYLEKAFYYINHIPTIENPLNKRNFCFKCFLKCMDKANILDLYAEEINRIQAINETPKYLVPAECPCLHTVIITFRLNVDVYLNYFCLYEDEEILSEKDDEKLVSKRKPKKKKQKNKKVKHIKKKRKIDHLNNLEYTNINSEEELELKLNDHNDHGYKSSKYKKTKRPIININSFYFKYFPIKINKKKKGTFINVSEFFNKWPNLKTLNKYYLPNIFNLSLDLDINTFNKVGLPILYFKNQKYDKIKIRILGNNYKEDVYLTKQDFIWMNEKKINHLINRDTMFSIGNDELEHNENLCNLLWGKFDKTNNDYRASACPIIIVNKQSEAYNFFKIKSDYIYIHPKYPNWCFLVINNEIDGIKFGKNKEIMEAKSININNLKKNKNSILDSLIFQITRAIKISYSDIKFGGKGYKINFIYEVPNLCYNVNKIWNDLSLLNSIFIRIKNIFVEKNKALTIKCEMLNVNLHLKQSKNNLKKNYQNFKKIDLALVYPFIDNRIKYLLSKRYSNKICNI